MNTLLLVAFLLVSSPDSSRTEMISVGKTKGAEVRITNIVGEEYYVDNYMDPVSLIMYYNTNGLPPGLYFVRVADKCEFIVIP